MCVLCYLSTDRVIDDLPFDENDPKFNVQRTEERYNHLTKRYVYYCGSRMSCGCGFGFMHITEDILLRTEREFQSGKLTDDTIWLWWNQNEPPPDDQKEFDEKAEEIRESHRDTAALYRLIEETCKAGCDCELLVCWAGDENKPIYEIFLVDINREQINVDFRVAGNEALGKVLLYRFVVS